MATESPPRHPLMPMVIGTAVIVLDQASKALAGPLDKAFTEPATNRELAFGALGGHWALLAVSAAVCMAALIAAARRASWLRQPWWALPVFVAGGLSNLMDRVVLGGVRDFLPTPWFVFNPADVAIVVALVAWHGGLIGHLRRRDPAIRSSNTERR